MLNEFKFLIIVVALGGVFVLGYEKGHNNEKANEERLIAKETETAFKNYAAKDSAYALISSELERLKNQKRDSNAKINKEVTKVITNTTYNNVCFDDAGVFVANSALTGAASGSGDPTKYPAKLSSAIAP